MQTPVQIDFLGMAPADSLRDKIAGGVSDLENHFGRITACRVVLKGPGSHHRTGPYEVRIHVTLPDGKQVDIDRAPEADERYNDVDFALNDAFRRARRGLQDRVRRLQGAVKTHEAQPVGTVVRLHDGYGFLQTADGRDVYFHRNSVLDGAFQRLKIGSSVSFVEEDGEKGPQASTVRVQD